MLFADFLAQFADVDIDRAVAHNDLVAPNFAVNLLACDELATARHEQLHERKLLARQGNLLASAKDRVVVWIELDIALVLSGLLLGVDALQNSLHAAYQELHRDWFREVIIRSGIEARELVILLAQGREKDDVRMLKRGVFTQGTAGLHAIHDGHHPIQKNQVWTKFRSHAQGLCAILCRADFVPLLLEVVADELQNIGLVIHEQNAMIHSSLCRFSRSPFPLGCHLWHEDTKISRKSFLRKENFRYICPVLCAYALARARM